MGNKLYEENSISAIANAIRNKLNTEATYKVNEMATAINSIPTGITPTGSIALSNNGTYDIGQFGTAIVDVPQPGKPTVPQTGKWQYKSTYPLGFIILGKDDDVADSAMFVRMVNGYGFPVTLNSSHQTQNNPINSDDDTEYSQYPQNSYSLFPNGGTINQLNKLVIKQARGEVAMHGWGEEKIWDSNLLKDSVLNTYYDTYINGGGTKTKEELKAAIMAKYSSTDVSQGATILDTKRRALQDALDNWVYSIGLWGGDFNFIIDDINCGSNTPVATNSSKVDIQKNFMGDGTLTDGTYSADPYYIFRDSNGLDQNKIETDLLKAYNNRTCIELFHHYYLDGSAARWNNFKSALDTLTSYVNQEKIAVVTRKDFYDLGEFVEHPISTVVISPKELSYPKGTALTENDFDIYTILDNGNTEACQSDKIVDLTNIDYTTAGTYTASIEYRGFFGNCYVIISNETPTHYLVENYSASGEAMNRQTNYGILPSTVSFENGKSYRLQCHFVAETVGLYANHHISFYFCDDYNNKSYSIKSVSISQNTGITEEDFVIEWTMTTNYSVTKFIRCTDILNGSIGAWSITNGYIYEIETPEGGE